MRVVLALVVLVLALVAWLGQLVSWIVPSRAQDWGLQEREADVEPAFFADARGEARWDACILWVLVLAAVLLLFDHRWWPYIALVGGGMYLYFAGRGIFTRAELAGRGFRIGTPSNVRVAYVTSAMWGLAAVGMIVAAIAELE